jgi:hypothetical protein
MKHRQRPEITIGTRHGSIEERADRIHPGIAVGDHHALRTRGGAAGVIDCEQISLANVRTNKFSRARVDHCFVVEPGRIQLRTADVKAQSHEVFNLGKLFANTIDRSKIIAVCADYPRTTMIHQVNEVVRCQAII